MRIRRTLQYGYGYITVSYQRWSRVAARREPAPRPSRDYRWAVASASAGAAATACQRGRGSGQCAVAVRTTLCHTASEPRRVTTGCGTPCNRPIGSRCPHPSPRSRGSSHRRSRPRRSDLPKLGRCHTHEEAPVTHGSRGQCLRRQSYLFARSQGGAAAPSRGRRAEDHSAEISR